MFSAISAEVLRDLCGYRRQSRATKKVWVVLIVVHHPLNPIFKRNHMEVDEESHTKIKQPKIGK